ncbi:hypothetical protein BD410DRAFT_642379 [Rickenella mellea]|uniref:Uncharacterized protein n=1 Tax=Rickenella mellea TaxID=50990 RepID=A0A4Y7PPA3_9AGAM|nr:hypothetical protein BD410DRAFT_642379 [Rickenella mellea]
MHSSTYTTATTSTSTSTSSHPSGSHTLAEDERILRHKESGTLTPRVPHPHHQRNDKSTSINRSRTRAFSPSNLSLLLARQGQGHSQSRAGRQNDSAPPSGTHSRTTSSSSSKAHTKTTGGAYTAVGASKERKAKKKRTEQDDDDETSPIRGRDARRVKVLRDALPLPVSAPTALPPPGATPSTATKDASASASTTAEVGNVTSGDDAAEAGPSNSGLTSSSSQHSHSAHSTHSPSPASSSSSSRSRDSTPHAPIPHPSVPTVLPFTFPTSPTSPTDTLPSSHTQAQLETQPLLTRPQAHALPSYTSPHTLNATMKNPDGSGEVLPTSSTTSPPLPQSQNSSTGTDIVATSTPPSPSLLLATSTNHQRSKFPFLPLPLPSIPKPHLPSSSSLLRRVKGASKHLDRALLKRTARNAASAVPAVLLGSLLNVLDGLSYGMIIFPTNEIFTNFGGIGVSMFFVTSVSFSFFISLPILCVSFISSSPLHPKLRKNNTLPRVYSKVSIN